MPIPHDSSFVADSTATSSPAPPPPRPARTYGRQRPSSSSRYEVLKTGLNSGEEVPASSDGEQELDHVVKDATTGSFRFAFQDELAALDENSDGDGEEDEKTLLGVDACPDNEYGSPASTCPAKATTGVLEESLTDLAISAQTELPTTLSTPSLLRAKSRRVRRVDSDSDPESESIQSTSSPVKRTRHSSTPPTSDDELPTADKIHRSRVTRRVVEEQTAYPQYSEYKSKSTEGRSKKRARTKAPTKKERKETVLNGARIAADRDTSIAQKQSEWNMSKLLKTIRHEPSSDPIQPFSSPQVVSEASAAPTSAYEEVKPNFFPTVVESDDEMPEVGDLRKKQVQSPRKVLAEKKKKILALQAQQQSARAQESDEDDDLVIAAPDTPAIRRLLGVQGPSGAKKTHSTLAGISFGSGSKQRDAYHAPSDIRSSLQNLKSHRDLNIALMANAQKVAAEQRTPRQRKSWIIISSEAWSMEVLKKWKDEDEEDTDYVPPDRGSASPPPPKVNDDDDDDDEQPAEDEDVTMVERDYDTETEDGELFVARPRGQRVLRVVEDDDSDAENLRTRPLPTGRILVEDSMIIEDENTPITQATPNFSLDEQSDKENNIELIYGMDDDKENATVFPRSIQRSAFSRSLFAQENNSDDGLSDADKGESVPRLPLSTLEEEKSSPGRQSFTDRLQSTISLDNDDCMPPPSLRPRFGFSAAGTSGFSQFSQTQSTTSALQPGFSDLYADATQKRDDGFTELFGGKGGFGLSKMRRTGSTDLDLTQDISLGPAFQVDDSSKLKEADAIFEKEQEYVLQEVNQVPPKQSDLYVNSDGYLTQTRPDTSPEVYRPLSRLTQMHTQSQTPAMPQTQRQALETLEYTPDLTPSLPSPSRKRRIVKRAVSPSPLYSASRSSSSKPQESKTSKPKVPLRKSEFVEAEAQESDDDEMRGFGLFKGPAADDDEEGQDLDQELPTLVDNTALDEATIAEEKVREKYQEQTEQDDLRLQKYHQDAADGKYRSKKRRNGVDLDDSDSDSDDDADDERRRRRMNKKQRTDMLALESNPTTAAFAGEYKKTIGGDEDTVMLHSELTEEPEAARAEETVDEDEEDEVQESITRAEIIRQVQERAQNNEFDDDEPFDPHNTDWLDAGSDDDEGVKVRSTAANRTAQGPRRHYEEYDEASESQHKSTVDYDNRMKDWAKTESRSGRLGKMSRSVGSAAITGHTKVKAGGGSLRQNAGQTSSSRRTEERPRPLKPAPSVLSGVDRSNRFG
ncbi:MRC1-like domain-containing protein [Armillaria borealis]|uniref:MRC1-like domain-containing protein n=1 Tax=Armillaria borealis TaxID=47425 RepID=A0AA39K6W2_9AGAR|nr:MRC1-like domain-containing protein [Armillaria borealis]